MRLLHRKGDFADLTVVKKVFMIPDCPEEKYFVLHITSMRGFVGD